MTSPIEESYDRVAEAYAEHIYDELKHKPFDRKMLDWFLEKAEQGTTLCDMGCGPGQIARYLHDGDATVCGIDLSEGMVAQAQKLNPDIPFQCGNMLGLTQVADGAFGGIAAFYSILHILHADLPRALAEFKRVLGPRGVLLVTFHIGTEIRHLDDWWGKPVSVDFIFFERTEIRRYLEEAGFVIEEAIERDPYPEIEVQTRRAYIFARTPE